ncbi:hypothetical protein VKS41_003935 [Umbelopsis sp. WA50703]
MSSMAEASKSAKPEKSVADLLMEQINGNALVIGLGILAGMSDSRPALHSLSAGPLGAPASAVWAIKTMNVGKLPLMVPGYYNQNMPSAYWCYQVGRRKEDWSVFAAFAPILVYLLGTFTGIIASIVDGNKLDAAICALLTTAASLRCYGAYISKKHYHKYLDGQIANFADPTGHGDGAGQVIQGHIAWTFSHKMFATAAALRRQRSIYASGITRWRARRWAWLQLLLQSLACICVVGACIMCSILDAHSVLITSLMVISAAMVGIQAATNISYHTAEDDELYQSALELAQLKTVFSSFYLTDDHEFSFDDFIGLTFADERASVLSDGKQIEIDQLVSMDNGVYSMNAVMAAYADVNPKFARVTSMDSVQRYSIWLEIANAAGVLLLVCAQHSHDCRQPCSRTELSAATGRSLLMWETGVSGVDHVECAVIVQATDFMLPFLTEPLLMMLVGENTQLADILSGENRARLVDTELICVAAKAVALKWFGAVAKINIRQAVILCCIGLLHSRSVTSLSMAASLIRGWKQFEIRTIPTSCHVEHWPPAKPGSDLSEPARLATIVTPVLLLQENLIKQMPGVAREQVALKQLAGVMHSNLLVSVRDEPYTGTWYGLDPPKTQTIATNTETPATLTVGDSRRSSVSSQDTENLLGLIKS